MILKSYKDFINEEYSYNNEELKLIDIIIDIIESAFKKEDYNLLNNINFLSDIGVKRSYNIEIEASAKDMTTYVELYFSTEDSKDIPEEIEVKKVLNNICKDYRYLGKREFNGPSKAASFLFAFNIKKVKDSDLFKSNIAVNKYKL